jgi:hypothetical protein
MQRAIDKLNVHHVAALMSWKATQGRCWKARLRECWDAGNKYGNLPDNEAALLTQVRNLIGPSGLSQLGKLE